MRDLLEALDFPFAHSFEIGSSGSCRRLFAFLRERYLQNLPPVDDSLDNDQWVALFSQAFANAHGISQYLQKQEFISCLFINA
jgi:hypothetical protein